MHKESCRDHHSVHTQYVIFLFFRQQRQLVLVMCSDEIFNCYLQMAKPCFSEVELEDTKSALLKSLKTGNSIILLFCFAFMRTNYEHFHIY